jgi:hypothetical protein
MILLSKGQAGDKWEPLNKAPLFWAGLGGKVLSSQLGSVNHPCKKLMPKILPFPKYVLDKTGHN